MRKNVLAAAVIALFLLPFMLNAAGIVTVKKTESGDTKRVVFDHKIHHGKGITQCKICHHQGKIGQSCSDSGCHQGADGTKKIHERCIGCHTTKGGNAPTQCAQCHKS